VVDFLVGGKGNLEKLQILAEIPIVSVPNLR
jgi:hypothetical protein